MSLLLDEFVDYLSICDDDISSDAWAEAEVVDGKYENEKKIVHYRIDVLWRYIAKIMVTETCNKRFKLLLQVASIALVLPHSNAGLEPLFIVRKNTKLT